MKVRATGQFLHQPQARVNYLTFSAEDEDERTLLAILFNAWEEGKLAVLLGEQRDINLAEGEAAGEG